MTPSYVVMYATVGVLSRIFRPQVEPLSDGRDRVYTWCACDNKKEYIRTWYVFKISFFILGLMRYTDVRFFLLSGVRFPREETISQLNETVKRDNIRKSDRHDRRYMDIPHLSSCQSTKGNVMLNLTSAAAACCCCCCRCCCYLTTCCWLLLLGFFFLFLPTLSRKLHGDGCCTETTEKFWVRPR